MMPILSRLIILPFVIITLSLTLPIQAQQAITPPDPSVLTAPFDLDITAALVDVMQFFADVMEISILINPLVEGQTISARVTNIPTLEAFEVILRANSLSYEVNETGRVVYITQADVSFSGRVTERILVNFVEVASLETVVGTLATTFVIDERTNSFVVTDIPARIRELRQIIETLDVPSKQVMVEVEIVAFDRSRSNDLGIQWDFLGQIDADSPIGSGVGGGVFSADGNVDISLGKFVSGAGQKNLLVELKALERDGTADILASPRLLTINRQAATISITEHTATGTRVVQSTSALGQTVTEPIYSDVGVTLEVTPAVAGDSLVILTIKPTVSTARRSPFFPTIAVDTQERTTETTVMAPHNRTIVIGGLHQTTTSEEISRVPILGHIPLLGFLFTQKTFAIRKTELVVFITPRIIDPGNIGVLEEPVPTEPTMKLEEDDEDEN